MKWGTTELCGIYTRGANTVEALAAPKLMCANCSEAIEDHVDLILKCPANETMISNLDF